MLEEALIRNLSYFSIKAGRDKTHPSIWIGGREIGAIGLKVKRWVTMHGFALNVDTNLEPSRLPSSLVLSSPRKQRKGLLR